MKTSILLFLTFISLISCKHIPLFKSKENYDDVLTKKEAEAVNKKQNKLGTLIATIEFGVQATEEELKDFEDGIIPWISIENPESEIDKLIDSDEIVIPYSEITIRIDYPLNKPTSFVLTNSKNGFTKKELILQKTRLYKSGYDHLELCLIFLYIHPLKPKREHLRSFL